MTGCLRHVALASMLLLPATPSLQAADSQEQVVHIRTSEREWRNLIDAGLSHSGSLRALADTLLASDVIMYVRTDNDPSPYAAGRLAFLSAAGGSRYVLVEIPWTPSRLQQISMFAHELQHAVEIADAETIVDRRSFAREYERIGFPAGRDGRAFDSYAAIETGARVWREMAVAFSDVARFFDGPRVTRHASNLKPE